MLGSGVRAAGETPAGQPARALALHLAAPSKLPLGRGFSAGGRTRTVGKIPACSLFRAVQCDSISTGPDCPLWFSVMLSVERGEFPDAS